MSQTLSVIIKVLSVISTVVTVLYLPKALYMIVGFFKTRKFPPAKNLHKYAILIAARNESAVIGSLLDSIRKQDYPEKVPVFVVADNCTDDTARIARESGAICYERTDPDHRTKGYALQFLLENIYRDYGRDAFEGYFLFDADNLLRSDYISRMNDAFDAGEKIITSYRNTKNYDDNCISSSYAIHWMRTIRNTNRGISVLKLTTRLQGTGFLFAAEAIEKRGWTYTSLTEDRAFSADAVSDGFRITYQNDAEFYDEQPTVLRQVLRQRIRWAKGHIQAFFETGGKLFLNVFRRPFSVKNYCNYDMLLTVFPRELFSIFRKLLVFILRIVIIVLAGFAWGPVWGVLGGIGINFLTSWGTGMAMAAYVVIIEHKHIPKLPWYRHLWHIFMFPLFEVIGKWSMIIALFMKVEWKPIYHNRNISIEEAAGGNAAGSGTGADKGEGKEDHR